MKVKLLPDFDSETYEMDKLNCPFLFLKAFGYCLEVVDNDITLVTKGAENVTNSMWYPQVSCTWDNEILTIILRTDGGSTITFVMMLEYTPYDEFSIKCLYRMAGFNLDLLLKSGNEMRPTLGLLPRPTMPTPSLIPFPKTENAD